MLAYIPAPWILWESVCIKKTYLLKTDLPSVWIVIDAIAGDILRQGLEFDGELGGATRGVS
jgi:hypothetical protein